MWQKNLPFIHFESFSRAFLRFWRKIQNGGSLEWMTYLFLIWRLDSTFSTLFSHVRQNEKWTRLKVYDQIIHILLYHKVLLLYVHTLLSCSGTQNRKHQSEKQTKAFLRKTKTKAYREKVTMFYNLIITMRIVFHIHSDLHRIWHDF